MSSLVSSDVLQCPQGTTSKLPPQWELAKILYSQGVPNQVIALQCHITTDALRKRILRNNWRDFRDGLKQSVAITINPPKVKQFAQTIVEAGEIVRQRASGALLTASEGLDALKPTKSLKSRRELAETVKAITDPAKTVFGWEDKAAGTAINLVLLQQAEAVQSEPGSPPIDIPSQVAQIQDVATDTSK